MKFKSGNEKKFLEIFNERKKAIAGFEGCSYLELRRSKAHGNWFMTFSIWNDEKNLDQYRFSDLFKVVWASVKPLFEANAEALSVWPETEGDDLKSKNFVREFGNWEVVWSGKNPDGQVTGL